MVFLWDQCNVLHARELCAIFNGLSHCPTYVHQSFKSFLKSYTLTSFCDLHNKLCNINIKVGYMGQ